MIDSSRERKELSNIQPQSSNLSHNITLHTYTPTMTLSLAIVGTLFIDISDIYCFGRGLPLSMYKDVYQWSL